MPLLRENFARLIVSVHQLKKDHASRFAQVSHRQFVIYILNPKAYSDLPQSACTASLPLQFANVKQTEN
jgi:hypothetical protein